MRGFAILVIAAAIFCGAHDAGLAQTSTPNVVSPPVGLDFPPPVAPPPRVPAAWAVLGGVFCGEALNAVSSSGAVVHEERHAIE
jgi:hypothetical protein